ncbi:MAG: hypothetical protein U0599_14225 [Vicinamibacteria bacterium]
MVLRAWRAARSSAPGDGSYHCSRSPSRTAAAIPSPRSPGRRGVPDVFDLVGPEPVTYARLLERVAAVARAQGRPADSASARSPSPRPSAPRRRLPGDAARWLDCLLCDEVADAEPLEALLGRP